MPKDAGSLVTIRPAGDQDGTRCAEIYLKTRRTAFHWTNGATFVLDDYYYAVEEEEVWVAEADGGIVGFVSVYRPENHVHNLFVDPGWQHRGIGSRLLATVCDALAAPARLSCLAVNHAARSFYERNGWVMEQLAATDSTPYITYRK